MGFTNRVSNSFALSLLLVAGMLSLTACPTKSAFNQSPISETHTLLGNKKSDIVFIMDDSPSMGPIWAKLSDYLNEFIDTYLVTSNTEKKIVDTCIQFATVSSYLRSRSYGLDATNEPWLEPVCTIKPDGTPMSVAELQTALNDRISGMKSNLKGSFLSRWIQSWQQLLVESIRGTAKGIPQKGAYKYYFAFTDVGNGPNPKMNGHGFLDFLPLTFGFQYLCPFTIPGSLFANQNGVPVTYQYFLGICSAASSAQGFQVAGIDEIKETIDRLHNELDGMSEGSDPTYALHAVGPLQADTVKQLRSVQYCAGSRPYPNSPVTAPPYEWSNPDVNPFVSLAPEMKELTNRIGSDVHNSFGSYSSATDICEFNAATALGGAGEALASLNRKIKLDKLPDWTRPATFQFVGPNGNVLLEFSFGDSRVQVDTSNPRILTFAKEVVALSPVIGKFKVIFFEKLADSL